MFLARQTIELLLKGLIFRDCGNIVEVKIGSGKKKRSIDNTHNLSALWDYYVQNMQALFWKELRKEQNKHINNGNTQENPHRQKYFRGVLLWMKPQ